MRKTSRKDRLINKKIHTTVLYICTDTDIDLRYKLYFTWAN